MKKNFKLSYRVREGGMQLKAFLATQQISKRTLTAIKYEGGKLFINDVERDVRHYLAEGDVVEVLFPLEKMSEGLIPEKGMLNVVYEDAAVLIINKPAGQGTIPSRNQQSGTIANYVAGKFLYEKLPATVHVVTRLDRNTSGLICIAKNRHIHHLLSKQLTTEFRRNYVAIVEGIVHPTQFTIEEPIGRKEGSIIERCVRQDGQYARTDVSVVQKCQSKNSNLTVVQLELRTGRTHQIRVHMAWAGYPLAGDDLYGGGLNQIKRQALHCQKLEFIHPLTREKVAFSSELPSDMKRMLIQKQ